ncbi:CAP domain-containing protein [Streptomyces sp. Go40/10]|uniref:CAP domain-containing protein n=1 Tax=Streptomyces sp. Go40/10 TaxID=2825844 RepID=UPI001E4BD7F7|nr:CAP domain-containing protein [Streptomyces sp. Go40/10]UFR06313.1 CAP domain-containing protein [Streptomyces sp. Go40/10]
MGQHRKTKHYRRIVVAAAAVGAVGVPSVALACAEWPYGTQDPAQAVATSTPVGQWQYTPGHHHSNVYDTGGSAYDTGAPQTTAPSTPLTTAPPSAHPTATKKATVHHPRRTATPGTAQATPSAPPSAPPSASAAPAAPSTPKPAATASGVTGEILQLVNDERAKAGCQALTLNPALTKAAQAHSADMASHQNMSHTGSDGSNPGDRITAAGYTWSSYGENVAYGYGTAEQVMAGWMASPGHRANILNCGFKEIGVGLAQPGSYWTQDFGTAR